MKDPNVQVDPRELARDPTTTDEQLRSLRTVYDPELDRLLAKHPNTPADLLEDLSHSADKATRRQVVRNASAPKDVLLRLAPQFPRDFLCNPVIDWLLIEEPDLLQSLGKGVLKNVLKSASCPEALMGWAARNGTHEHQLALTMNPAATPEILQALAALKGDVGAAARSHVLYPKPSRQARGTTGQFIKEIKSELAGISPDHAQSLWRRGLIGPAQWLYLNAPSRAAVIGLPPSLRGGREPDSVGCRAFAKSVSGPESLLEFLSKHPDEGVRLAVAENPNTPAFVIESLTKGGRWSSRYIREGVARNPSVSVDLLEVLAKDSEYSVRFEVARNSRTPSQVLKSLAETARHDMWGNSIKLALAGNISTPIEVLEEFACDKSEDWSVQRLRTSALHNIESRKALNEKTTIVEKNVHEPVSVNIEYRDAKIPTTVGRAMPIASVFDLGVAFFNPDRRKLWGPNDPFPEVVKPSRVRVAPRAKESPKNYDWLIEANDQNTPSKRLEELAGKQTILARWLVAANPNTPEGVRKKLAFSLAFALGLDALPPEAKKIMKEVRPQIQLVMDARHWWHKLHLQAQRSGYAKLPRRLSDEELIERFKCEIQCFERDPRQSLTAAVLAAGQRDIFWLNDRVDRWSRSPVSIALKLPLRKREAPYSRLPFGIPRVFALMQANAPVNALVKAYRSVDWMERMAVARNPNAPRRILTVLKGDANRFVAQQAGDTETLQRELLEWPVLAPKILDHWQLSLTGLTHGSSVWDGFEGETTELMKEVREHRQALKNFLIEGNTARHSVERVVSEIELRIKDKGIDKFLWRDEKWVIRLGVTVFWPWISHASEDTLTNLKSAINPQKWNDLWLLFAHSGDASIRSAVAKHPHCPDETLLLLAKDESAKVLAAFCSNPRIDQRLMTERLEKSLGKLDSSKKRSLAALSSSPILLEVLAEASNGPLIRETVAQNQNTPLHVLELLMNDPSFSVRAAVASNPSTNLEMIEYLSRDNSKDIQCALLKNPNTPESVLICAMKVATPKWFYGPVLARHPATPQDLLAELARSFWPEVRRAVATNHSSPSHVLDYLSSDRRPDVRATAAKMDSLPKDAVLRLAADKDEAVRVQVAKRADLPAELLRFLSKDKSASVREAVASHPNTAPELVQALLASLAKDRDPTIRAAVAHHTAVSSQVLTDLANDDSQEVRVAVTARRLIDEWKAPESQRPHAELATAINAMLDGFGHQDKAGVIEAPGWTSVELLRGLFGLHLVPQRPSVRFMNQATRSSDWLTRLGVALHPMATQAQLKLLEKDEVPHVVAAVQSRHSGIWAN